MIVVCGKCRTQNRMPAKPRIDGKYRCALCKRELDLPPADAGNGNRAGNTADTGTKKSWMDFLKPS